MKSIPGRPGRIGFTFPMLLGTFERELSGVLEVALRIPFDKVVNVGAAEGYYAIGLALRLPTAHIVAFDLDPECQEFLSEMARVNHLTERVSVLGMCEPRDLEAGLSGGERCLIVCDVEGYEHLLIDPTHVPSLHRSWILVELHEQAAPGIGETLEHRFAGSHRSLRIYQEPRTARDYPLNPLLKRLPTRSWQPFLNEQRAYRMSWLWLEPSGRHH